MKMSAGGSKNTEDQNLSEIHQLKQFGPKRSSNFFKNTVHKTYCFLQTLYIGFRWNLTEIISPHIRFLPPCLPEKHGLVVVLTGCTRGIGAEILKGLLTQGAHVIMGVRSEPEGRKLYHKIRSEGVETGSVKILKLDLNSLSSVRTFSETILKNYPLINVLINNAGIMFAPYTITEDGFESQFQVNYLGHFLLTILLLPRLIAAGKDEQCSRIVNVSSVAQYGVKGHLDFSLLTPTKSEYSSYYSYNQSKLLQSISTKYLNTKLENENFPVRVYSVHPGVVRTDLYRYFVLSKLLVPIIKVMMKTPQQGADGVLFVALSPKVEKLGGNFFGNCTVEKMPSLGRDYEVQKKLWAISCQMVGLDENKQFLNLPSTSGDSGGR